MTYFVLGNKISQLVVPGFLRALINLLLEGPLVFLLCLTTNLYHTTSDQSVVTDYVIYTVQLQGIVNFNFYGFKDMFFCHDEFSKLKICFGSHLHIFRVRDLDFQNRSLCTQSLSYARLNLGARQFGSHLSKHQQQLN